MYYKIVFVDFATRVLLLPEDAILEAISVTVPSLSLSLSRGPKPRGCAFETAETVNGDHATRDSTRNSQGNRVPSNGVPAATWSQPVRHLVDFRQCGN